VCLPLALLLNLGGPLLTCQDHRIEFDMVEQEISPQEPLPDFDPHIATFSARYADCVPPRLSAQSAGQPAFGVLPAPDGGVMVWALR
jgi:hypothetical protein